jgi:hypothetical protein
MQVAYEKFEQTKRACRRDGWNRGIRAAAKWLESEELFGLAFKLQALLKPPLENPTKR